MSQDRSKLRWNGWGWVARRDDLAAREDVWAWLAGEFGMPALLATPARALEELSIADSALAPSHRAELAAIVGESQVRDSLAERAFHARGRRYRDLLHLRAGDLSDAPDAVVYPRGTEEVLAVLSLAAQRRIAVIPFGGGTGLQRGAASLRGECESVITLDLSDMDRVIAIDPVSLTAEVETGIYAPALETALKAKGLTLGSAMAEFSTLGGCVAGATKGGAPDWLLSAKLAAPTGLIDTTSNANDVDLTPLLRGSEGQFGVITEATIRLKPCPKEKQFRAYLFPDFSTALAALRALLQEDCSCAGLYLGDAEDTRFFGAFEKIGTSPGLGERLKNLYRRWRGVPPAGCRLVVCFEGDAITPRRHRYEAVVRRCGGVWSEHAASLPSRDEGYLRDSLLERAVGMETFSVTAPWSKLQNVYATTQGALEMVLRETAPREGAKGVVLGQVRDATTWNATLTFTALFPRVVGSDLSQADKIATAAYLAMQASGGLPRRNVTLEKEGSIAGAIKDVLDPKGVLARGTPRL